MKIVWVVHGPNEIYTNIFEAMKKQYPKLDLVMVVNDTHKNKIKNDYFRYIFLKKKNLGNFFFWPLYLKNKVQGKTNIDIVDLFYFKDLKKILKQENPDTIISLTYYRLYTRQVYSYCKQNNILMFIQTEIKKYPTNILQKIYTYLSLLYNLNMFNYASKILPWTTDSYNFVTTQITSKEKCEVIPPGINTDIFKYVKTKKDKNILNILMVARFVPFKRHIDLVEACKILKEKHIKFKVTLCGNGPLLNTIKQKVKDYNLSKYFTFIHNINYKEMNKLYSSYDVLILPSYNESIGMVVPEGMACKLPAIISDTCGCKTYIKNNVNGLIFKTYDINDLVEKIIYIQNKKVRNSLQKQAYNTIKNIYNINEISDKMYNIIKTFIKDQSII